MKSNYSLETVYQIWNDLNGSRIEVGTDKDGLDLVQIRSIDSKGEREREVTLTVEEAALVRDALSCYLGRLEPAALLTVPKMQVMTDSTAMLVSLQAKAQQRIEAIKTLRRDLGWGLKEAKEWLDRNHPMTGCNGHA